MATFLKTKYILAFQILHQRTGKGNDLFSIINPLLNWSEYVQSELVITYLIFNVLCF